MTLRTAEPCLDVARRAAGAVPERSNQAGRREHDLRARLRRDPARGTELAQGAAFAFCVLDADDEVLRAVLIEDPAERQPVPIREASAQPARELRLAVEEDGLVRPVVAVA